jgi:hypothetical protein
MLIETSGNKMVMSAVRGWYFRAPSLILNLVFVLKTLSNTKSGIVAFIGL